jgi:hypothetical protein
MRKAKYTQPVTIYLDSETYNRIRTITDETEISICEWFREVVKTALSRENQQSYL